MQNHLIFWEVEPNADLAEEITTGAAYYEKLFGYPPNVARVHPTGQPTFMLPTIQGISVYEYDLVPAGKICLLRGE